MHLYATCLAHHIFLLWSPEFHCLRFSEGSIQVWVLVLLYLWPGGVKTSPNLPCWRITACWLFINTYSLYLQLPSVSAGWLCQPQCNDAPCLGDSDPLPSHHTHVASILYTEYKHHYHGEKFLEKLIFTASLLVINSWMGSNQVFHLSTMFLFPLLAQVWPRHPCPRSATSNTKQPVGAMQDTANHRSRDGRAGILKP